MLSINALYLFSCRPLVASARCLNLTGPTSYLLESHHYRLEGGVRVRNVEITPLGRSLQLASH